MSQLDAFDYVIEGPDRSLQAFKYIVSIWSETPPLFSIPHWELERRNRFLAINFFIACRKRLAHITLQVKGCQYVERFVFIINALFTYSSGCECEELTIQNWKYVCYMKYVFNLLSNDVAFFAEGIIEMWPFCTTRFTYFHRFIWLGFDWNFFQVSRFSIRCTVEVLCYWRWWVVFMKSWFGTSWETQKQNWIVIMYF